MNILYNKKKNIHFNRKINEKKFVCNFKWITFVTSNLNSETQNYYLRFKNAKLY